MEIKNSHSQNSETCKVCKQRVTNIFFYEEKTEDTLSEKEILNSDQFCGFTNHAEIENREIPSVKLTCFVIYDKYNHFCSLDNGLVEKGISLYFSGYVKTIDNEETSINNGLFVQNAGPIKEWWIYGFDGGEKSLIGLSTEHAAYYLVEPSDLYKSTYENLQQKSKLSKIIIEFLLDFSDQNPSFEDMIEHVKRFNLPEAEEFLFREAQFICNQIVNFDEEPSDEVPLISFACIQTLINLTGIIVSEKKDGTKLKGITKHKNSVPQAVGTRLVSEVFGKCFDNQFTNKYASKDNNTPNDNIENFNNNEILSSTCFKTEEKDSSQMYKPSKHKECSKLVIHDVKWLKKTSFKYNGNQGFSSASVDDFIVHQGDFIMLQAEEPNEPLRIAKICYMYDSLLHGAMFHAHFFCRGIHTILGNTANPRELFVVDDCDDYPLGSIIKKAEVEYIRIPENWVDLGNKIDLQPESSDNGVNYHFSKIYDYEFSKFKDYIEDVIVDNENTCLSCSWQKQVKNLEIPIFNGKDVIWKNEVFSKGTAVFLEPGQNKVVQESTVKSEIDVDNDKIHTEIYRKKFDINRGSNLDTPEPFTIGLIETIKQQRNDIKLKVRMFYRPEDTRHAHFLAYISDINYLFWTNHVVWTTFKNVTGKCYVTYCKDECMGKEWSKYGPFRFYYSKAYDHIKYNIYEVPLNEQNICCEFIERPGVRITRSHLKDKGVSVEHVTESPPMWPEIDKPLRCMDIYAGCGGLSKGLHQSGVAETLWAVEKETAPAQAYKMNNPHCHVFTDDCNNILKAVLDEKSSNIHYPKKGDVELLVGGPPCQGYSGMNRFSSRQESYFNNSQIITYLSYCDYYRPKYFIFENVRNFVSCKKSLILKLTLKCLLAIGYQISFGILQAGNFGIPQTRRRFILMGAAPGYALPTMPNPLHVFSRSGTFLSILVDGLRYDTGNFWSESLPYRTICVRDAIADLPDIPNGAMITEIPYEEEAVSYFQKCMRNNKETTVRDHICKEMSLIVEARITQIPTYPGADWRDLPNIGIQLKNGSVAKVLKYPFRKSNQTKHESPRGVCKCAMGKQCDPLDRQFNTLIPWFLVHTADKHNNWGAVYGRLEWDGFFGTTITNPEPTGTQGRDNEDVVILKNSGENHESQKVEDFANVSLLNLTIESSNFNEIESRVIEVLHPDQNRVVSVRECARSQGFPDDYKFFGTILDKHRQIGNAVPPPLASALGREIIKSCNININDGKL